MKTIMAKTPHDSSFSFSFSRRQKTCLDEEKHCEKQVSDVDKGETKTPKKRIPLVTISRVRSVIVNLSKLRRVHLHSSGLGTRVVGTLFGYRRGHVHLAFQEDPKTSPAFLIELATPINGLVREMASGLVRIALECDKKCDKKGVKLLEESLWRTYCNGKKCGFAMRRECGPEESKVLKAVEPISMGAGVLPGKGVGSEGELMYMRAKFERVVGSRDSEAFYMMNPDGNGGPELSVYLLRVEGGDTDPLEANGKEPMLYMVCIERFYLSHVVVMEFLVVSVEDTNHWTEGSDHFDVFALETDGDDHKDYESDNCDEPSLEELYSQLISQLEKLKNEKQSLSGQLKTCEQNRLIAVKNVKLGEIEIEKLRLELTSTQQKLEVFYHGAKNIDKILSMSKNGSDKRGLGFDEQNVKSTSSQVTKFVKATSTSFLPKPSIIDAPHRQTEQPLSFMYFIMRLVVERVILLPIVNMFLNSVVGIIYVWKERNPIDHMPNRLLTPFLSKSPLMASGI
ncbi:hypothetical protein GIB67_038497 [Kingdonia uniflora]|uniref:Uncharacterized protein n=1 Tax=Kingdonia uniflora TaxID=39325 RepID=A0A7J7NPM6_9MAGN|nr:hypothetical protein GIB67_038497 [Kingdonia uniflora]